LVCKEKITNLEILRLGGNKLFKKLKEKTQDAAKNTVKTGTKVGKKAINTGKDVGKKGVNLSKNAAKEGSDAGKKGAKKVKKALK
jgi:hypothetical protein